MGERVGPRVGPVFILVVMGFMVLFYFAGNYMIAPILETLHKEGIIPGRENEWRFWAGLLRTVPIAVGLAFTFFWGVLGDKVGRRGLIAVLGVIMGAALILVSTSTSYLTFLAFMTLFGIGLQGIGPVIYAFIADVVPSERRGFGYAIYYASSVFGMVVGLVLAGMLFHWRTAYMVSGVPVILLAILVYAVSAGVTVGYADKEAVMGEYSLREALREALTPSVLIIILQILAWAIPWGMLAHFSVDYIMTRWGLPKFWATLVILVATISIAFGHIIGGAISDRLAERMGPRGRPYVSIFGIAVGYAAMVAMLAYPYPYGDTSIGALLPPMLLAAFGMMFTTFAYPNISTVISDCVRPEHRGTVFSFYNILNSGGWAIGPSIYGALVYFLAPTKELVPTAMMYSAVGITSLWLISLAAWVLLLRHYPRDYARVKAGAGVG